MNRFKFLSKCLIAILMLNIVSLNLYSRKSRRGSRRSSSRGGSHRRSRGYGHRGYYRRDWSVGPAFAFGLTSAALIAASAAENSETSNVSYSNLEKVEKGLKEELNDALSKLTKEINNVLKNFEKDMDELEKDVDKVIKNGSVVSIKIDNLRNDNKDFKDLVNEKLSGLEKRITKLEEK
ncbi:hypothetical protein ACFLYH_00065 [Candidatus Dependentiae bacterium]